MKAKIQLLVALTSTCLLSGCVVPGAYYGGPVYGAPVDVVSVSPDEVFVPDIIIVENGVRHDRFFYARHPEFYRRDQVRYPDRFARRHTEYRHTERVQYSERSSHRPPVYSGRAEYHSNVAPHAGRTQQARPEYSRDKKKKHHDSHDHQDR